MAERNFVIRVVLDTSAADQALERTTQTVQQSARQLEQSLRAMTEPIRSVASQLVGLGHTLRTLMESELSQSQRRIMQASKEFAQNMQAIAEAQNIGILRDEESVRNARLSALEIFERRVTQVIAAKHAERQRTVQAANQQAIRDLEKFAKAQIDEQTKADVQRLRQIERSAQEQQRALQRFYQQQINEQTKADVERLRRAEEATQQRKREQEKLLAELAQLDKRIAQQALSLLPEKEKVRIGFEQQIAEVRRLREKEVITHDEANQRIVELRRQMNESLRKIDESRGDFITVGKSAVSLFALQTGVQVLSHVFDSARNVVTGFFRALLSQIQEVENLRLSLLEITSIITQFSSRDIPASLRFLQARREAEGLLAELIKINARTLTNLEDTVRVFEAIVQAGVSARDALELTEPLANAVAILTRGMGIERQIFTEIRAIFEGTINANSRIAYLLEQQGFRLRETIPLWKAQGTLVENMKKILDGFSVAGIEFGRTFQGLVSRIQAEISLIRFEGLRDASNKTRGFLEEIVESLRENRLDFIRFAGDLGRLFTSLLRPLSALIAGATAPLSVFAGLIRIISAIIDALPRPVSAAIGALILLAPPLLAASGSALILAGSLRTLIISLGGLSGAIAATGIVGKFILFTTAGIALSAALTAIYGASRQGADGLRSLNRASDASIQSILAYAEVLKGVRQQIEGLRVSAAGQIGQLHKQLSATPPRVSPEFMAFVSGQLTGVPGMSDTTAAVIKRTIATREEIKRFSELMSLIPASLRLQLELETDLAKRKEVALKLLDEEISKTQVLIEQSARLAALRGQEAIETRRHLEQRLRLLQQTAQEQQEARTEPSLTQASRALELLSRRMLGAIISPFDRPLAMVISRARERELRETIEETTESMQAQDMVVRELAGQYLAYIRAVITSNETITSQEEFLRRLAEALEKDKTLTDQFREAVIELAIDMARPITSIDLLTTRLDSLKQILETMTAPFRLAREVEQILERLPAGDATRKSLEQFRRALEQAQKNLPKEAFSDAFARLAESVEKSNKALSTTGRETQGAAIGLSALGIDVERATLLLQAFAETLPKKAAGDTFDLLHRLLNRAKSLIEIIESFGRRDPRALRIVDAQRTVSELEQVRNAIEEMIADALFLGKSMPAVFSLIPKDLSALRGQRDEFNRLVRTILDARDMLKLERQVEEDLQKFRRQRIEAEIRLRAEEKKSLADLLSLELVRRELDKQAELSSAAKVTRTLAELDLLRKVVTERARLAGLESGISVPSLPDEGALFPRSALRLLDERQHRMTMAEREALQASLEADQQRLQSFSQTVLQILVLERLLAERQREMLRVRSEEAAKAIQERRQAEFDLLRAEITMDLVHSELAERAKTQALARRTQRLTEIAQTMVQIQALKGEIEAIRSSTDETLRRTAATQALLRIFQDLQQALTERVAIEQELALLAGGDSTVRQLIRESTINKLLQERIKTEKELLSIAIERETLSDRRFQRIIALQVEQAIERENLDASKELLALQERLIRLQSGDERIRETLILRERVRVLEQERDALENIVILEERLREQATLRIERIADKTIDYINKSKTLTEILQDAHLNLFKGLEGAFDSLIDRATQKLGLFRDFVRSLLQDLIRLFLRLVLAPIFTRIQFPGPARVPPSPVPQPQPEKPLPGQTPPERAGPSSEQITLLSQISEYERQQVQLLTIIASSIGSVSRPGEQAAGSTFSLVHGLLSEALGTRPIGGEALAALPGSVTEQLFNIQTILISIAAKLERLIAVMAATTRTGSGLFDNIGRVFGTFALPEGPQQIPTTGLPGQGAGGTGSRGGVLDRIWRSLRNIFSPQNLPGLLAGIGGSLAAIGGGSGFGGLIAGIGGAILGHFAGQVIGTLAVGGSVGLSLGALAVPFIGATLLAAGLIIPRLLRRGREKREASRTVEEMFANIREIIDRVRMDTIEGEEARRAVEEQWQSWVNFLNTTLKDKTVIRRSIESQRPFFEAHRQWLETEIIAQEQRKRIGQKAIPEFQHGGVVPALLDAQELIVPPATVARLGIGKLQAVNSQGPGAVSLDDLIEILGSATIVAGRPLGFDHVPALLEAGSFVIRQSSASGILGLQSGGLVLGMPPELLFLFLNLLLARVQGRAFNPTEHQVLLQTLLPLVLARNPQFSKLDDAARQRLIASLAASGTEILSLIAERKPIPIGLIGNLVSASVPLLPEGLQQLAPFIPVFFGILEGIFRRPSSDVQRRQQGGLLTGLPDILLLLYSLLQQGGNLNALIADQTIKAMIVRYLQSLQAFKNLPDALEEQIISAINSARTINELITTLLQPSVLLSLPIFSNLPGVPGAVLSTLLPILFSGKTLAEALRSPLIPGAIFQTLFTTLPAFANLTEEQKTDILKLIPLAFGAEGFNPQALLLLFLKTAPTALKSLGLSEDLASLITLLAGGVGLIGATPEGQRQFPGLSKMIKNILPILPLLTVGLGLLTAPNNVIKNLFGRLPGLTLGLIGAGLLTSHIGAGALPPSALLLGAGIITGLLGTPAPGSGERTIFSGPPPDVYDRTPPDIRDIVGEPIYQATPRVPAMAASFAAPAFSLAPLLSGISRVSGSFAPSIGAAISALGGGSLEGAQTTIAINGIQPVIMPITIFVVVGRETAEEMASEAADEIIRIVEARSRRRRR